MSTPCDKEEILGEVYYVYSKKVIINDFNEIGMILSKVPETCVAQVFSLGNVPSIRELVLAAHYVFMSFKYGKNILRNRNYEFLLYLARNRQFKEAVKTFGIKVGDNCLVEVCRGATAPNREGCDEACKPARYENDIERLALITRFYVEHVI